MTDYGNTPPPPPPGEGGATPPPPPAGGSYGGATPPPPPSGGSYGGATPPPPPAGSGYDGGAYGAPAPSYQSQPVGAPVEKPKSIALAVKLMFVGAGLAILGALSTLLQTDAMREAAQQASEDLGETMTSTELDAVVAVGVGFALFSGLVGALLWVLMAVMNGKGKKWARIVATVFFVLSVLFTLVSLTQEAPILSRILSVVSLALGGYIIFLLYRPESTQYYDGQSAARV